MRAYFFEVIGRKRAEPGEDLISVLVRRGPDRRRAVHVPQPVARRRQRDHPQHDLRRDLGAGRAPRPVAAAGRRPDRSLPSAVEEILRWTTRGDRLHAHRHPGHRRWAASTIAAGDPVLMLYCSANRDEAQFGPTADRFDVGRDPNHHLAFGFGAHFCIGAALARLEVRLVLEELLARFRTLEPAGEVAYSPSDIIAGVTSAPFASRVRRHAMQNLAGKVALDHRRGQWDRAGHGRAVRRGGHAARAGRRRRARARAGRRRPRGRGPRRRRHRHRVPGGPGPQRPDRPRAVPQRRRRPRRPRARHGQGDLGLADRRQPPPGRPPDPALRAPDGRAGRRPHRLHAPRARGSWPCPPSARTA